MKLSEYLKRTRFMLNKSQREISKELELSFVTYNNLESGKGNPSFKTIRKLAKYFGLSEAEIREME